MNLEKFANLYLQNPQQALKQLNGATAERKSAKQLIWDFEKRYEMKSSEMETRIQSGGMPETHEICQWLSALHTLRATEYLEAQ